MPNKISAKLLIAFVFVVTMMLAGRTSHAAAQWPQAAGPNHNWTLKTDGEVPTSWSVENDQNILWRTPLEETAKVLLERPPSEHICKIGQVSA